MQSATGHVPALTQDIQSSAKEEKAAKLLGFLHSVLDDEEHRDHLAALIKNMNIDRSTVEKAFLAYNMDIFDHDNEIYKSVAIRVVLYVHTLIRGSWHIDRQNAVCELLSGLSIDRAIDLGFGAPSRYMKELLQDPRFHLTLCDFDESHPNFTSFIFDTWSPEWQTHIQFLCENFENVSKCVEGYDLFLSLFSLEHATKPLQMLKEYVQLSKPTAKFLIDIPVGPITPEHTIEWLSVDEAMQWIESSGLKIIDSRVVGVNPEVDLFAEQHGFNYLSCLMLCEKK